MSAATKALPIFSNGPEGETWHLKVATNAVIYKGTMVAIDANGYAKAAGLAAANGPAVAVAEHDVDNTGGADGAKQVRVQTRRTFTLNNGAGADEILQATAFGAEVYVVDDNTIGDNDGGATRVVAGKFMGLDTDTGKPRVYIEPRA